MSKAKASVMAAGDTFRAAAVEQLQIWGERTGTPVVAGGVNADSAGLAFDALSKARAEAADVLLIDTAGRLHNKAALMDELREDDPRAAQAGRDRAALRIAGAGRHDGPERRPAGEGVQGDGGGDRPGGDQARR